MSSAADSPGGTSSARLSDPEAPSRRGRTEETLGTGGLSNSPGDRELTPSTEEPRNRDVPTTTRDEEGYTWTRHNGLGDSEAATR
ncbi:hypothetical protein NDU88_010225 [Pleurodeles waltl]|uniref:Uncharacterized protein n=1 Tax=Pleurodeles waltl TaxID=8319 RepID=A0AAV7RXJ9_PLEWA|nr:hypothetical protein NDU88_010225 [Pleurodeles waltl]